MYKLTDEELFNELKKKLTENKKSIDELKELTDQLKDLNRKLEESEKLKSHFLSNIRNEIINPLAAILGLSKNILSFNPDEIDRIKSFAGMIHSEAFTLDFQLQNIFAAAEIEAGESSPSFLNIDINQLVTSVIDLFRTEIERKQINIIIKGNIKELTFVTDPGKLKLIILNLLSNSIKFSNITSKIELLIEKHNSQLIISVKDFGIGIKEVDQSLIFDRFKRINNDINSLNIGHGLGLSIVKALVDLLEGTIEVKSRIREGSLFVVKLPEAQINDVNDFLYENDQEVF